MNSDELISKVAAEYLRARLTEDDVADASTFHRYDSDLKQRAEEAVTISVAFRIDANRVEKRTEIFGLFHQQPAR